MLVLLWLMIIAACGGCQSTCGPARPLIGITSVYKVDEEKNSASTLVNFAYVKAVAENGGAPLVLPTISGEETLRRYVVDGGFGLFVQWHPELTNNAEHRNAIYGALIQACAARN